MDDKDSNNRLKNFLYYMLISTDEEGGIKSLIDILVEKVIRKKTKSLIKQISINYFKINTQKNKMLLIN